MSKVIPIHIKDAVLDIKDKFAYPIKKGGQNINVVRYPASIQTSTSHSYPIQTPSLNTVMSKNLVWGSEITLEFTGTVGPQEYLINPLPFNLVIATPQGGYLGGDCPAAFPLNSLCNNMRIQINNQVVSQEINKMLDPILRNTKVKDLNMWNASTPTQLDYFGNFEQQVPNAVSVAAITANPWLTQAVPFIPTWNSAFNPGLNQNLNNSASSRSSFRIMEILGNDPAGVTPANRRVFITLKVREPIMCSPFQIQKETDAGISGINMMSINCDMDSTGLYCWNWIDDTQDVNNFFKKLVSVSYANSYIEATYYTPHDSQLIPSICVNPLTSYVLFKGETQPQVVDALPHIISSGYTMLNYYPESVTIYVANLYKDSIGDGSGDFNDAFQGWTITNSYLTIIGVSITLGLNTGILSTYDITDLYLASVKSGSAQTFQEFSGQMQQGLFIGAYGDQQQIPTCGSVLKLNFADIIAIQEEWYAPGSLCNLQFKVDITYINVANQFFLPQCRCLFEYKGYISNQGGKTEIFTSGVLNKEDVLGTTNIGGLNISETKTKKKLKNN